MRYAYPNELYHYGILGQKWGVRRFQNPDGSLTSAGRQRYGLGYSGKIKATKYEKRMAGLERGAYRLHERNKALAEKGKGNKDALDRSGRYLSKVQKQAETYYSMPESAKNDINKRFGTTRTTSTVSHILIGMFGIPVTMAVGEYEKRKIADIYNSFDPSIKVEDLVHPLVV